MGTQHSLIVEIEDAIKSGSSEKRVETLRRVTDLFLNDADRLNEAQIGLFDDVLCHLIKRIETKALVELSGHLAPVDNSPIEVIRQLARNDEIAVAGPMGSPRQDRKIGRSGGRNMKDGKRYPRPIAAGARTIAPGHPTFSTAGARRP